MENSRFDTVPLLWVCKFQKWFFLVQSKRLQRVAFRYTITCECLAGIHIIHADNPIFCPWAKGLFYLYILKLVGGKSVHPLCALVIISPMTLLLISSTTVKNTIHLFTIFDHEGSCNLYIIHSLSKKEKKQELQLVEKPFLHLNIK